MNYFSQITLLITHYNRSSSLNRLLATLKELDIFFAEIIVSDDGSDALHLKELRQFQATYKFSLITAEKNSGLGNNINKGQKEVKTPYTLYVQEDFELQVVFTDILRESVTLLEKDSALDLIRYFAHFRYPYLSDYATDFEEVTIPAIALDYNKIYAYSDTPHLRRTSFCEKFGWYAEGINSDRMEYRMCISFLKKKGKCLIHKDFKSIFKHLNFEEEPSTVVRPSYQQSTGIFIGTLRYIYRQLRYNFDLISF
ncbi:glycosyltransferase family A protein [Desertivirga arenae]|uniref:glycosyltransferase family A protein n=1 Tax=Desertivirga arenae TaxID=2810309 RepID=UPI001A96289C|nr:glycosyltransferase family A protein [Pedobacter sp. SYSU D00823]